MCRGANIIFWQVVGLSKKGFQNKNVHFIFVFFVLEKEKEIK